MTTKTVLDVLSATTAYFSKNAVESPRLNAEHLVAHVLGKKRIELYLAFDRPLAEAELEPLRELVRRRAAGEPLQHLLGTVEFCGRGFLCDRRALIPRPETEQLCEWLIAERKQIAPSPFALLDAGTGSGVIALTLAAEWLDASVTAVDVSADALELARENADKLGLRQRVVFRESDLFSGVADPFDLIVANLPYIASEAIETLSREVRRDPRLALDGGADGAEIVRRLAVEARVHLHPNGMIALEVGHAHAEPLSAFLAGLGYAQIRCKSDYCGVNRFLFANYG